MKPSWLVGSTIGLIVILIGSNVALIASVRKLVTLASDAQRTKVDEEAARLAGTRTRLETRVADLDGLMARVLAASKASAPPSPVGQLLPERTDGTVEDESDAAEVGVVPSSVAWHLLGARPEIDAIEALSEEERLELFRRRDAIPVAERPSPNTLLGGDLDSILSDPSWNPNGVELTEDERVELAQRVSDFRYFFNTAPRERHYDIVKPAVEAMKAAGAYEEYAVGERPPVIEGVMSHSGLSDRPGFRRLYYFFPEDYPDLYRRKRVEEEQGLGAYLAIHSMLRGAGSGPAGRQE